MHLSKAQYQTLESAVSRIIPADDTPGALEGGAVDYILGQFGRNLREELAVYRLGLDAMDLETIRCHGIPFAHLTVDRQDALLTDLEQGVVQTDWPVDPRDFFAMLVNHTAEGFYSDPANGGNRAGISWEIIGF